jgi:hypothetical protein
MRVALLLACLLALPAFAGPPTNCGGAGLGPGVLSVKEWDLVNGNAPASDPVISEARFLLKASDSISAEEIRHAVSIPWTQARRIFLLGAVSRVYTKYPAEGLYMGTRSGRIYVTKVTGSDNFWDLTKRIDPCHLYISVWQP